MKKHTILELDRGDLKRIAAKVGCRQSYLSKIRHGYFKPSPAVAEGLERELGIPFIVWMWPEKHENAFIVKNLKPKKGGKR